MDHWFELSFLSLFTYTNTITSFIHLENALWEEAHYGGAVCPGTVLSECGIFSETGLPRDWTVVVRIGLRVVKAHSSITLII